MADDPARRRVASDDELALWRLAMRDAVPLRPVPKGAAPTIPEPVAVSTPAASPPRRVTLVPAPAPPQPRLPPLVPGRSAGIDRRTDERLRRGELVIEGRIDLHGLTQSSAHDALCRYLDDSQRAGRRCILVITGKGAVSQGGGVLRNAVPRWLAEPGLRQRIVAIHHAQPQHGGDGALYVLLKRKRAKAESR